jgi:hypothetical protein
VSAKKIARDKKMPDFSVAFKAMIQKVSVFFSQHISSSIMFVLQGLEKKIRKM